MLCWTYKKVEKNGEKKGEKIHENTILVSKVRACMGLDLELQCMSCDGM